ncbi:hypothetical protein JCM8547_000429 [Rhodosporidiobolus lusitaniae]
MPPPGLLPGQRRRLPRHGQRGEGVGLSDQGGPSEERQELNERQIERNNRLARRNTGGPPREDSSSDEEYESPVINVVPGRRDEFPSHAVASSILNRDSSELERAPDGRLLPRHSDEYHAVWPPRRQSLASEDRMSLLPAYTSRESLISEGGRRHPARLQGQPSAAPLNAPSYSSLRQEVQREESDEEEPAPPRSPPPQYHAESRRGGGQGGGRGGGR